MKKHFYGLHLIELIIVLSIISILITFSIPIYSTYLVREKRLQAEAALIQLAIAMEQYAIAHNSYADANLKLLNMDEFIVQHHYQLILQINSASDYVLMAKPLGNQAENDKGCGTLSLNAKSEKNITGENKIDDCW